MIFLVSIPYPATELRLQGDGALQVLAQLRQLYPSLTVVTAETAELGEESDEDWIDITETEWYRTRAAQITPGRCLRIYRENIGLTLIRLAELSGIERRLLSQMEHGQLSIGESDARTLAEHLGCHYQSLL